MVKRWLATFSLQPSSDALPVVAEDLDERMRRQHHWSVKNDDESLETAAVAAAREQMVTACSIWASLE